MRDTAKEEARQSAADIRTNQCLACVQNCPAKAINYKNKTHNRKWYTHLDISWKDLAMLNGYEDK